MTKIRCRPRDIAFNADATLFTLLMDIFVQEVYATQFIFIGVRSNMKKQHLRTLANQMSRFGDFYNYNVGRDFSFLDTFTKDVYLLWKLSLFCNHHGRERVLRKLPCMRPLNFCKKKGNYIHYPKTMFEFK